MEGEETYKFKTEDNSNILPLIGILVVLIILVGGGLYLIITSGVAEEPEEPPPIKPPPVNVTPGINETNVTVCGDECHYNNALMNESAEECGLIEDQELRQGCYEQLADVSLAACLEVTDAEKKDFCVTSFAVSNEDIDLCDLLTDKRDDCRKQVDSCIGTEHEELCRALREEDPELCDSESDCLLNYSITKDDAQACDLIQNPVIAAGCRSAVKETDKCYDLGLKSERDYCYQIYATYTNDYLVCTSISLNSIYRLNCLSMFAASEANHSVCDIGGLQLDDKWACYTNYSLMTGNLAGCEAIHVLATTNKYRCASEFAQKYGNPAACMLIENIGTRETCYEGAILYYNENLDPQYCGEIMDFNWKNKCFNEAAKLYDDVSICDGIIADGFAHKACIDAYEYYKSQE